MEEKVPEAKEEWRRSTVQIWEIKNSMLFIVKNIIYIFLPPPSFSLSLSSLSIALSSIFSIFYISFDVL